MFWIGLRIEGLLLLSCVLIVHSVTAIPLEEFYDFGEEFGDTDIDVPFNTYLGSEPITVSKQ